MCRGMHLRDAAQSLCMLFGKLCYLVPYLPCCHRRPRTQTQNRRLAARRFIRAQLWDRLRWNGGHGQEERSSCSVVLGEVSATTAVRCSTVGQGPGLYTPMSICYWMPATLGRDVTLGQQFSSTEAVPSVGRVILLTKGRSGWGMPAPPTPI